MKLYADLPGRRTLQILADVGMVVPGSACGPGWDGSSTTRRWSSLPRVTSCRRRLGVP